MIRLGIVGSNYGRTVQLPAFRADSRCEVVALAGSNAARTAELARADNIPKAYGDWRALVEDANVQAVAIATLPSLQAQIAIRALELGKPVFAEKPLASDLGAARAMLKQASASRKPTMIDFNFHQIMAWQRAKSMIDANAIGTLRHVTVHWHVESRAIQTRMRSWKTVGDDGGGVLGNFISHCFHYLEWFCGPIAGLSARVSGLPSDKDLETTVAMAIQLAAGPLVSLSMSCASFLGAGHKIEFFGEDGTLQGWAHFEYARSDRAVFSEPELKTLSARFEFWNVMNSLRRGELALLSNFVRPGQVKNFRKWITFFAKALRSETPA